ncbi:TIGR01777 family oxidoreductase [Rubritalea marina]|uniref:TIGR01777 family oxidoreductase n=1 Tax=Rubritalea marina TaxID=361055 RepID=UPI00035E0E43|nr:TIGR01777 family oxidoreductase [Rubritalea marina]
MKSIVIVGANGFLGRVLSKHFLGKGWKVIGIARTHSGLVDGVEYVHWDAKQLGPWVEALEWVDALVNLSGRSVNCRYHQSNRELIRDSRVHTTELLGEAVSLCTHAPRVWLNASTATIYKHAQHAPQGDDGEVGTGFSVEVAKAWESAFFDQQRDGVRQVAMRTAIVMSQEAKTVWPVMQGLARRGLGGTMGSGQQMVSWISDLDFARAVEWLLGNKQAYGTYNLSAPEPLPNAQLMGEVRDSVNRPCGLSARAWMLEIGAFFMRTETELVLKSRWVLPSRLVDEGFRFQHENLREWRSS